MPRIAPATSGGRNRFAFKDMALFANLPRRGIVRFPSWLPKILAESVLIVLSILLALAVDQWQEDKEERELVRQSLQSFRQEIQQNKMRLDDIVPYHTGVQAMLTELEQTGAITSVAELQSTVGAEGLRPPFLLDTAWKTAMATGALTIMDYETVSALSMTYTLQDRFREYSRSSLPAIMPSRAASDADVNAALRSTITYLNDVTAGEEELRAVYEQAVEIVESKLAEISADSQAAANE